jgi:L-histidine N-alpha-methyltransferase
MRQYLVERLSVERWIDPSEADTLCEDVRRGLSSRPFWLPPKHLYDQAGSRLFEEICALPEYYPTRTEARILREVARAVVRDVRPHTVIELGSGSAAKTRLLLDEVGKLGEPATYMPIDISAGVLEASARRLLEDYRWLSVRAVVADFERELGDLPQGEGVLLVFLGGTIGNFEEGACERFLARLAAALGPGAALLLGTDMVKDRARLERAYNDASGVTARFNLNLLTLLNRRLGADFDPRHFEHLAFFNEPRSQIEMHLRARRRVRARIRAAGLELLLEPGETIRTEVSRKFTPQSGAAQLARAGFSLSARFAPQSGDFSLWLALVAASGAVDGAEPLAWLPAPL